MKILFLHEVGYLEKPIFEMHEFPEHLAERGHEVAFADYLETRNRLFSSDFGSQIEGRVVTDTKLRLYSQTTLFPGILGRIFATLQFPVFFGRVLRSFKPDLVVSFAVPTSGWQAALICRALGIPLVFRALDVSHKIRKTIFARIIRLAEKIVYSKASWVSCNNPALMDYCISLGADTNTSSVDYPPLDLSHFLRAEGSQGIRADLGISPQSQIVLYMGSFFYFSGLTEVIRELALIEDKPHLILIGGGEQGAELRQMTKDLDLDPFITFTGFVKYDELPAYLSVADVTINPMTPSLVSNKALPNKVLQYMASGCPVVSTRLDGLSSVFSEADGIRSVSNSAGVMAAAVEMLSLPHLRVLGESNRALVSSKFELAKAVDRFEELLITLGRL